MPKPYSQDLRERVIGVVEREEMSARAAGRVFGVSESTAIKWVSRWRRTGRVAAKPMGGYKKSPLEAHAEELLGLIAAQPDLTVDEIRSELRSRGIRTGRGSVWRFCVRHGISFKKNRARHGAGSSRRGVGATTMASRPGETRSQTSRLHR